VPAQRRLQGVRVRAHVKEAVHRRRDGYVAPAEEGDKNKYFSIKKKYLAE
jgi:hypothetical protein